MFVFMIASNPLLPLWLAKLAPMEGCRFYHMDKLEDAPFFIQDLKPDVLVLETSMVVGQEAAFRRAWAENPALAQIPVVGLGLGMPPWLATRGCLPAPHDPSRFFSALRELV